MRIVFKAKKTPKGKIYQAIVLHNMSSNLSVILQMKDAFADVSLWDGAELRSLTPGYQSCLTCRSAIVFFGLCCESTILFYSETMCYSSKCNLLIVLLRI